METNHLKISVKKLRSRIHRLWPVACTLLAEPVALYIVTLNISPLSK